MVMRHEHWYDIRKGFDNDHPKWHTITIPNHLDDFIEFGDQCGIIIEWMYTNINHVERHCRWSLQFSEFHVKFRYEKDYTWFRLTWQ